MDSWSFFERKSCLVISFRQLAILREHYFWTTILEQTNVFICRCYVCRIVEGQQSNVGLYKLLTIPGGPWLESTATKFDCICWPVLRDGSFHSLLEDFGCFTCRRDTFLGCGSTRQVAYPSLLIGVLAIHYDVSLRSGDKQKEKDFLLSHAEFALKKHQIGPQKSPLRVVHGVSPLVPSNLSILPPIPISPLAKDFATCMGFYITKKRGA